MENKSYDEVNPEEIIIKLKEILVYLQKNKANLENGKNISNPLKN